MQIGNATAISAQILIEADRSEINRPAAVRSVTVQADSGNIGFLVDSFDAVRDWAKYLGTEYQYHEAQTMDIRTPSESARFGFANTTLKSTHWVDDTEEPFSVNVFYNERV
jgi:hypothetical protein